MICNVGTLDRVVRILFSIVLIGGALYFIPATIPKTLILAVAVFLLASGWFGVCYFYKLVGLSTAPAKSALPE